jgi:phage baseplate assembly protein W
MGQGDHDVTDVSLEWGADFQPDSTGDLQTVDGDDEVRQRLERRLFTAVHGYVWHPDYGAGLPQKIGTVLTVSQIRAVCASQLALEESVAVSPPAQLTVTAQPGGVVVIDILYWDAKTGVAVSFSITA